MKRSTGSSETSVVLLRGINLGGHNKLPMKVLVPMMETLGCKSPRHYIQSGNVVFRADAAATARLPAELAKMIRKQCGIEVPVVLRSAAELRAAARDNPFLEERHDPENLHVMFLADTPPADRVASLDPQRSPPDAFALRGRDLFLSLPNGVARSKLTNAYVDSKLRTVSTARNWRTVLTLVRMCNELEAG